MPKVSEAHILARRQQILMAACICMGRTGFRKMSIKDVCRQAKLSPGAVYTYFQGKEAILQALAEDGLRNSDVLLKELEAAGGVRAAIHAFFEILEDSLKCTHDLAPEGFDANRIKVALWVELLRDPGMLELFDGQYQGNLKRFARIVRAGQRDGEMARGIDGRALAQVITSLYEGLTLQRALWPEIDLRKYYKAMFALIDGTLWLDREKPTKEEKG